ncbi:hypothetical protein BV898_15749 [Hypsibius exemplaris]|uniref:Uncharacterized protein n=1 Tax=Hypsibius exemplaris TaxID=2072580 RepID=A0A9X6NBT1_HYPEX|nr:hypothetical protein BV898_15749 [Hypsibius exemplaris]
MAQQVAADPNMQKFYAMKMDPITVRPFNPESGKFIVFWPSFIRMGCCRGWTREDQYIDALPQFMEGTALKFVNRFLEQDLARRLPLSYYEGRLAQEYRTNLIDKIKKSKSKLEAFRLQPNMKPFQLFNEMESLILVFAPGMDDWSKIDYLKRTLIDIPGLTSKFQYRPFNSYEEAKAEYERCVTKFRGKMVYIKEKTGNVALDAGSYVYSATPTGSSSSNTGSQGDYPPKQKQDQKGPAAWTDKLANTVQSMAASQLALVAKLGANRTQGPHEQASAPQQQNRSKSVAAPNPYQEGPFTTTSFTIEKHAVRSNNGCNRLSSERVKSYRSGTWTSHQDRFRSGY